MGMTRIPCDTGPTREVLERGGNVVLVTPRSSEALAEAVIELARNPELANSMGRGVAEEVQKRLRETQKQRDNI